MHAQDYTAFLSALLETQPQLQATLSELAVHAWSAGTEAAGEQPGAAAPALPVFVPIQGLPFAMSLAITSFVMQVRSSAASHV